MSKHTGLLGIRIYEIDTKLIYEIKKNKKGNLRTNGLLPRYTFGNEDNIIDAEYYLQFVGLSETEENKNFFLFDISTLDDIIDEEIRNLGEEEFLNNFNLKEIINKLEIKNIEEFKLHCQDVTNYLIIDINYDRYDDFQFGGYEYDISYKLVGYLDKDMNKIIL